MSEASGEGAPAGTACALRKALASGPCACRLAERTLVGEREVVHCTDAAAAARCARLAQLLRERARFALRLRQPLDRLPHGVQLRIYCGGLLGLQLLLRPGAAAVDDVDGLLRDAALRYGALEALPYEKLLAAMRAYTRRRAADAS